MSLNYVDDSRMRVYCSSSQITLEWVGFYSCSLDGEDNHMDAILIFEFF